MFLSAQPEWRRGPASPPATCRAISTDILHFPARVLVIQAATGGYVESEPVNRMSTGASLTNSPMILSCASILHSISDVGAAISVSALGQSSNRRLQNPGANTSGT